MYSRVLKKHRSRDMVLAYVDRGQDWLDAFIKSRASAYVKTARRGETQRARRLRSHTRAASPCVVTRAIHRTLRRTKESVTVYREIARAHSCRTR